MSKTHLKPESATIRISACIWMDYMTHTGGNFGGVEATFFLEACDPAQGSLGIVVLSLPECVPPLGQRCLS